MPETVFAMDATGRLVDRLTEKQAKNAVIDGRAEFVGLNVVQYHKIFHNAREIKFLPGETPLLDTAVPRASSNGMVDSAAKPRVSSSATARKNLARTRLACDRQAREDTERTIADWRAWGRRHREEHPDYLKPAGKASAPMPGGAGYGEIAEACRLGPGEKPIIRGGGGGENVRTKVRHGVYYPVPTPNDIAAGWQKASMRRAKRRECWRRLREIYRQITGHDDLGQSDPAKGLKTIWLAVATAYGREQLLNELLEAIKKSQHPKQRNKKLAASLRPVKGRRYVEILLDSSGEGEASMPT